MAEIFCVDETRPPYKPTVGARVLADVIWFDEGYRRAKKGELLKLDAFDSVALSEAGQVELVK